MTSTANTKLKSGHWITLLLMALVVVVLLLAWQAVNAYRTQDRVARQVLTGYAQLVADSFGRELEVTIGFRTIYQATNQMTALALFDDQGPGWTPEVLDALPNQQVLDLIAGVLRINSTTDEAERLYGNTGDLSFLEVEVISQQAQIAWEKQDRFPFFSLHPVLNGKTYTVILVPGRNPEQLYLLLLTESSLNLLFQQIYDRHDVLPAALSNGEDVSEHIHLSVADTLGESIFASSADYVRQLSAQNTLSGEYSGLFKDFVVTASIHPDIAPRLIIGGLPYGRVPVLLLLMLLALILAAGTWLLIRQQRKLMEVRSDFIARVSHELRTPLTQIRMYAETLQLGRARDKASSEKALKVINREAIRLGALVDNILQFSKPKQSLSQESRSYACARLFRQLQDEFQPMLDARQSTLIRHCPDNLMIRYDRQSLTQVLTNLLDNALKYGPESQTITLSAEQNDQALEISVSDQGPGIPAAEHSKIFHPYYRLAREHATAIAGTGIGLSVARELVQSMGGDLDVKNESGTRMVITLPLQEPAHG